MRFKHNFFPKKPIFPPKTDFFALNLLFHDVLLVKAQGIRAIDLQELESLISIQATKSQHWEAAQVLQLILRFCVSVPKSKKLELAQVVMNWIYLAVWLM